MEKTKEKALLAVFLALPLGLAAAAEIGKPAPGFELPSHEGKAVALEDYKGKIVVLEWLNEGCPFVRKHYHDSGNLPALQKKYADKGVVWLSVVSSAPGKQGHWATGAEAAAFKEAQKASMSAILLDPKGGVGRAYGAKTTPHLFVVGKDGALLYAGAIDDKPSTRAKDISKAKNWLAQALDEALSGKPVSVPRTKAYGCSVKYAD